MSLRFSRTSWKRQGRSLSWGLLTGLVTAGLLAPADLAVAAPGRSLPAERAPGESGAALTGQQRVLHALNRFTFGPTPGEVAAVQHMGLDAWFNQQLHPERIDDAALTARLDQYPAMRLSQAELVERFPTPGMLRRYATGALVMPGDPVERILYADASRSYEDRKQNKATKKPETAVPGSSPQGVAMAAAMTATPPAEKLAADEDDAPAMDPALRNAILNLPPEPRMQKLLSLQPEQMASLQRSLKGPGAERLTAGMRPEQAEEIQAMRAPERMVADEVLSTRLLRDVYSQRQLQAVMADLWLNHFSVYLRKNQNEPYLLPAYERETILPNSLGNFEDLLVATAKSPAMLVYLDNWESTGPNSRAALRAQQQDKGRPNLKPGKKRAEGINENYARELMELHTLGVQGGYTQQDVIEVAKCFTGWTVDRPGDGGEFLFNPNRHEPGDKFVLGHVIHEGGMNEGLEVLHLLATSPATAHFVSLKLAQRFVSDTPPSGLVDRMAASFLKSRGDLKTVLLTLYHSPEFWSRAVYRAKVKTPIEFLASALRATGAEVTRPEPLVQAMARLGMPIYGMQTPNGYSWLAEDWVSSNALLTRMNFALVLAGNRLQGTHMDWPALAGAPAKTSLADGATEPDPAAIPDAAQEKRLELAVLGQPASTQTRAAAESEATTPGVQQQAEQSFRALPVSTTVQNTDKPGNGRKGTGAFTVNAPETPLATEGGLLLGSPDFQRR